MSAEPPGPPPDGPPPQDDMLLRFTHGDVGRARALRANLEVLRGASGDRDFSRLVDDVLAGRRSLREAVRAPEFDREIAPRVERFGEWWDEKSEDEREALAEEGAQALDEAREER
jgi:hypothetical protein